MHSSAAFYLALAASTLNSVSAQWASTTTFAFDGDALPTGLIVSTDTIEHLADADSTAKFNHQFNAENVQVSDGFLQLTVPGGQSESPIQCGEVSTEFEVMYASVSTHAMLTDEAGICNGMFFYHNDSQEIDIEWISDPESTSNMNTNNGTRVMQYTNQGSHGTEDSIEVNGQAPDDATSAVHEYRIDWTEGMSSFYLDGVFQQQIDENVPTTSGAWTWNAWTNGDPEFTVGPPRNDAVFKIQRIVMRYNTTADGSQGEGPSMSNTSQSNKESAGPQSVGSSGIALAGPETLFSLAVAGSLIARWLS